MKNIILIVILLLSLKSLSQVDLVFTRGLNTSVNMIEKNSSNIETIICRDLILHEGSNPMFNNKIIRVRGNVIRLGKANLHLYNNSIVIYEGHSDILSPLIVKKSKNLPLSQAFPELSKETGYIIIYRGGKWIIQGKWEEIKEHYIGQGIYSVSVNGVRKKESLMFLRS